MKYASRFQPKADPPLADTIRASRTVGFTLLELVLVLLLIGILAFSALPVFKGREMFQLDNATKKIESDLQYTQNLAITTTDAYGFRTLPSRSNRVYEIYRVSDGSLALSPYDHLPMQEDLEIKFPSVSIAGTVDVQFNQAGLPHFIVGGPPIVVISQKGATKLVDLNFEGLIKQR
jgi:prepilin-type N-terminal cleavage/methylation domain-containing protein